MSQESEVLPVLEWQYECDDYGIVGVSFVCFNCNRHNRFVSGDMEPHRCFNCGMESMPTCEADI